ncbi:MAG: hypothetical protein ABFD20_00425 [Anaerolineales bacterium]
MDKWKRVAKNVRIAAWAVLLAVLGFVAYQTYDFYHRQMANSPTRVTQEYLAALGAGDWSRAYALTNPTSLTSLYGRRASQSEVLAAFQRVTGPAPQQFQSITAKQLARKDDRYYVEATLVSAGGARSRLVLEVTCSGGKSCLVTFPFGLAP